MNPEQQDSKYRRLPLDMEASGNTHFGCLDLSALKTVKNSWSIFESVY